MRLFMQFLVCGQASAAQLSARAGTVPTGWQIQTRFLPARTSYFGKYAWLDSNCFASDSDGSSGWSYDSQYAKNVERQNVLDTISCRIIGLLPRGCFENNRQEVNTSFWGMQIPPGLKRNNRGDHRNKI